MCRRILILILIIAFSSSVSIAGIYRGNGTTWGGLTLHRGNGSTWDALDLHRGNSATWDQLNVAADTSCDNLGTWGTYYDIDHTDGTAMACITGDTTDTVSYTTGVTFDGTTDKYVTIDGALNHYLEVPVNLATGGDFRIEYMYTMPNPLPTSSFALLEWGSAGARCYAYLQYHATLGFRFKAYYDDTTNGGADQNIFGAYQILGAGAEIEIILDVSAADNNIFESVNSTSADHTLTMTGFTAPSNGVRFGEDLQGGGAGSDVLLDDIYIGASQQ